MILVIRHASRCVQCSYRNAENPVEIVDADVPIFHFASRILDAADSVTGRCPLDWRRWRNRVQLGIVEQTLAHIVDFPDHGLHQFERLISCAEDETNINKWRQRHTYIQDTTYLYSIYILMMVEVLMTMLSQWVWSLGSDDCALHMT